MTPPVADLAIVQALAAQLATANERIAELEQENRDLRGRLIRIRAGVEPLRRRARWVTP